MSVTPRAPTAAGSLGTDEQGEDQEHVVRPRCSLGDTAQSSRSGMASRFSFQTSLFNGFF
jgi:hypothetical protein